MQDIYLSLNNNILRVTLFGKDGLRSYSNTVSPEVVNDTKILDTSKYAEEVKNAISQVTESSLSKLTLNVVTEPEDTILRFITINKRDGEKQEQLLNDIKAKVTEVPLEDLFFSYQKIAPFLYQFVGVKKDYMEKLLEVSNAVGISLKSVVPWLLLLPKYVGTNDPAVFIARIDGSHAMALSELNGIFYSGVSNKEITSDQIEKFVSELSFYKKKTPVKRVYTLNYQSLDVAGYEVAEIGMPPVDVEYDEQFKLNILVEYVVEADPDILFSQNNLLNLMPLPVEVKSNKSIVYVGASAVLIFAGILSFFLFFNKNKSGDSSQMAVDTTQQENVLSERVEAPREEAPSPDLKKEELDVMVLNGAGVNGLAARTKTLLEDKGYKVFDIDTADEVREDTLLRFKKDSIAYKALLEEDLKDAFPNIVVEDSLDDGEDYDLLIIAGTTTEL